MELRTNSQIELAHEFLCNTGANIFLTGRAGTGKTTFLRRAIESMHKRVVVAAPTGVAAINAGGVTLHSLFQLPFSIHLPGVSRQSSNPSDRFSNKMGRRKIALIRSIELLVIDEISMVRCDLLDAIDETLRRVRRSSKPFGGVQLLLIGDIQQLSPICRDDEWELLREHYATPYFFDSRALKGCGYITIELQEIFRQSDPHFTSLLNAIRDNNMSPEVIEALNKRYIPGFNPPQSEGYITLSTHNASSNAINTRKLKEIASESKVFTATIKGEYPQSGYPNDQELELKVGAQVIFIKNDISPEKLYYNGLIGEVTSISDSEVCVRPNSGGKEITVGAVTWENIEYSLDTTTSEIREDVKGSYSQLPLRCAWSITIHKSQGLSFDRAIIDASSSFAHGQVYVALSRCRSLEGMVLSSPLNVGAVIKDSNVESFNQYVRGSQPCEEDLERHKRAYFYTMLCEVFGYGKLYSSCTNIVKLLSGHLYLEYPQLCNAIADNAKLISDEVVKIGERFQHEVVQIISQCADYQSNERLRERVEKASRYFAPRISSLEPLISEVAQIDPDSAELKKRLKEGVAELSEELVIKTNALKLCCEGFSVETYQRIKVESLSQALKEQERPKTKAERRKKESKEEKEPTSRDILHQGLYDILKNWRSSEAEDKNIRAYMVLSNRALLDIQAKLPRTIGELKGVNGIGAVKLKQFGEELVTIVRDYCYDNDL